MRLSLISALLVFWCVSGGLLAQEDDSAKDRWSFIFDGQRVSLEVDTQRAAVILDASIEDGLGFLRPIVAGDSRLEPVTAEDEQRYTRLWFLRFRDGVSESERLVSIERLAGFAGVTRATVVLRYDTSLVMPKPELLLQLDEDAPAGTLETILAAQDLSLIREFPGVRGSYHLAFDGEAHDVFARSRRLATRPGVYSAEPNFILKLEPHATPNDPFFSSSWYHENTGQTGGTPGADLNSTSAWDTATGSTSITIAICDEGVDVAHEDLAAHIVAGHDSTNQASPGGIAGNCASTDGHGTSCAGIAAAVGNNGIGVTGVCWSASIMPVRLGYGSHWTEDAWIVDALTWSTDNGADVISNSWGGGPPSGSIQGAIQYANSAGRGGLGCPVLFSSGNGNGGVSYPAAHPESIAVGSTSPCDERKNPSSCDGETWWGSNFGPELDIVVPGVLMYTTDITGSGGYTSGNYITNFNGTSSACPNAAGCAALLLSVVPGLTEADVQTYLENSADDLVGPPSEDTAGRDDFMGWGRVNLQTLMGLANGLSPVTSLTCNLNGSDVDLTWTNGDSYDNVLILRNGVQIASLPGSATSYTNVAPPPGNHTYGVRGVSASDTSVAVSCTVFVTGGATDLVWGAGGGVLDGGAALAAALTANGRSPLVVSDLTSVPDLNVFLNVWVNLGIWPDNHVLTASESTILSDYLTDGTGGSALYMEGGDTWAYDTQLGIHALFNITGLADGTGDLATVTGTGAGGCDLTGLDLDYTSGENAWIDHLSPTGPAFTIQVNSSPAYDVGIFHDATTYKTIGVSYELGGLTDGADTKNDLVAAYLGCFLDGTPPITGLTCQVLGADVALAWTNGGSYSDIEIYRDGGLIATISGGATSYSDVAPPPGPHDYDVVALAGGSAAPAVGCSVTVVPAAPSGLSCSESSGDAILGWSNGATYDLIEVERNGAVVATLGGAATSYTDTGPPSGSHVYGVRGLIAGVPSPTTTCNVDITPAPVTSLTCAQVVDDVVLGWDLGDSYDTIVVERNGSVIATLSGAAIGYTDNEPGAGAYSYAVTGIAGGLSAAPAGCSLSVVAPTAPTALTCQQVGGGAQLDWTNNDSYSAIEVRRGGALIATLAGTATSYTDAAPGVGSHDYDVSGLAGTLESGAASCNVTIVVSPVTGLSCVQSGSGVQLDWTNGESYSQIELRRNGNLIAVLGGAVTTYFDNGPGVGSHDYEVTGYLGGSAASPATCSVTVAPPAPITGLVCQQVTDSIELTWNNGAAYATIEIHRDGGLLATIAGTFESYVDNSPVGGFAVYNVIGISGGLEAEPASCLVEFSVPQPTGLSCSESGGDVTLDWTNAGPYDTVEVSRDGDVIATLAGSVDSYTDFGAPVGLHAYSVVGLYGAVSSDPTSCAVNVDPAPVSGLDCSQQGSDALLTWSNGGAYDSVEIHRDGGLIATIPGGSTSFVDVTPGEGTFQYDVRGVVGSLDSAAAPCVVVIDIPTLVLTAAGAAGFPGQSGASHNVLLTNELALLGFSYGLEFDPSVITVADVNLDGTITGAIDPEFFGPLIDNVAGNYTVGVIMNLLPPLTDVIPPGTDQPLVHALFDVNAGASVGELVPLQLPETLGSSPTVFRTLVVEGGDEYTPQAVPGLFQIIDGGIFRRGDADGNGVFNGLADALFVLAFQFQGGPTPPCMDAVDFDDNGVFNGLADGLGILAYQFQGGPPPPPPGLVCGVDPTDDALDCLSYPCP